MITKLIIVLLCTTLYTIIRYIKFGDVSPTNSPVFLLNKSVAMASMFSLFIVAKASNQSQKEEFWGTAFFHLFVIHLILSISILSKSYYPEFFNVDKLTFSGELTLLFGSLAAYCFLFARSKKFTFMPQKWPAGLPPISLISFVFVAGSSVLFYKTWKKSSSQN